MLGSAEDVNGLLLDIGEVELLKTEEVVDSATTELVAEGILEEGEPLDLVVPVDIEADTLVEFLTTVLDVTGSDEIAVLVKKLWDVLVEGKLEEVGSDNVRDTVAVALLANDALNADDVMLAEIGADDAEATEEVVGLLVAVGVAEADVAELEVALCNVDIEVLVVPSDVATVVLAVTLCDVETVVLALVIVCDVDTVVLALVIVLCDVDTVVLALVIVLCDVDTVVLALVLCDVDGAVLVL